MEPMELYILSVYKFEFFQRLSTGCPGFLGVSLFWRVYTQQSVSVKHTYSHHLCGEGSLWFAMGSGTLHISVALQARPHPSGQATPPQHKLGSIE